MSMHPLIYSTAIPPQVRVGRFVADEPRLGWMFPFVKNVPKAELYIVGGTVRDAVKGLLPQGLHLVIRHLNLADLQAELQKFGAVSQLNDTTLAFKPRNFKRDDAIEIAIPVSGQPDPSMPIIHDLGRRDFSVNAMAYSLNTGLIIDPFGGLRDIQTRTLRTVGRPSARFSERPLRTLRALRIAARHAYKIDDGTWRALKDELPRLNKLTINDSGQAEYVIPRQHIGREFLKTLSSQPGYGFKLWDMSGASDIFTPELQQLGNIHHRDGVTGLQLAERTLANLSHPLPSLVFAGLMSHLEDAALSAAKEIIVRLHLHSAHPQFSHNDVLWMLQHKNILEDADPEHLPASQFEQIFGKTRGRNLLTFLYTVHRASSKHSKTRDRLHKATRRHQQLVTDVKAPLLRGRDLEALGVAPGPKYRKILAKIRDAQLDGHIANQTEALNFARQLVAAQAV
ncbi:MAG: hypothetical protein WAZ14_00710 [Patescibacteria group bacterium]